MLPSILVDREPLESQHPPRSKLGFYISGDEYWRLHCEFADAVFDEGELEGDYPCHFDGAAKGDFAVALRKVQVADGESRSRYVHGEIGPRAAAEVLDVAVSAVLGTSGDGAGTFGVDLGCQGPGRGACVRVCGIWEESYDAVGEGGA